MARVWMSTFGLNSTVANMEWTSVGGSPTIQSTTVRSGIYALQISSLSSGVPKFLSYQFAAANSDGPYFTRFYLRVDTLPTAENTLFAIANTAGTGMMVMRLDASGQLIVADEDGVIGSPSSALSLATWYRVEVKLDRTPSAGSHVIAARVDGVDFVNVSNRDLSGGVAAIFLGGNLAAQTQTVGNWYFDDIAINDSTGSFENSWPGDGKIVHLHPDSAGDNSGWGSGAYTDVDEVTPDDNTTVIATQTNGATFDVNLEATPADIGATDVIKCVAVGMRASRSTTGGQPNVVLRIKAASGGTVEESAAIVLNANSYQTHIPATPHSYQLTLYDLPGASTTPWTKADLDTAQIGVRLTNAPGVNARVSTLWLAVEYAAAVGGGGGGGVHPILGNDAIQPAIFGGQIVR